MAWKFVTKAEAAEYCQVPETFIKDAWSTQVERLIETRYKYNIGRNSYVEKYDGNGTPLLIPRHAPIVSIDSIEYLNYYIEEVALLELFSTDYEYTNNYIKLLDGKTFPRGVRNIQVTYTAGVNDSSPSQIDDRLATAELACLAHMVKYHINSRGDDSIKFASTPSLGTNQYSSRPGLMRKMIEEIELLIPCKVRMR